MTRSIMKAARRITRSSPRLMVQSISIKRTADMTSPKTLTGFWFQGEQKWYAIDDVLDTEHGGGHNPHVDPAPAPEPHPTYNAQINGSQSIIEGSGINNYSAQTR